MHRDSRITALLIAAFMPLSQASAVEHQWEPVQDSVFTEWGEKVTPENVHQEYPRPQMVRNDWLNLNGLWDYSVLPREVDSVPSAWQGKILVPFPVESALSGVGKEVKPEQRLWYRRSFEIDVSNQDERIVLHFGAVDWESTLFVNGRLVGQHRGGYNPFQFDITDALQEGENEIALAVWDPVDEGSQPRGKQTLNPRGIWYTNVTGIWQTVWLEKVNRSHIQSIRIEPDLKNSRAHFTVLGASEADVSVSVLANGEQVAFATGLTSRTIPVHIQDPKPWSPDSPFLYDLKFELLRDGKVVDVVTSYFGMRDIDLQKDDDGIQRLFLNGRPLFHYGLLDQGWWPDGLYTAPSDDALRYDIEITKELGYNMIRKHVKVEPARWYYWADKLGVLVWQDMPNGGEHPIWIRDTRIDGPEIVRDAGSKAQWKYELEQMVDSFYNHPSIVVWVPFNERWGQFETEDITNWVRRLDKTRLINSASGGNFRGVGDILDIHTYPGPAIPPADPYKALVQGEFGGIALEVEGHTWVGEDGWGYVKSEDVDAFNDDYLDLVNRLRPLISMGLSAAVYTQTTDVESEINGIYTYDRRVLKLDAERVVPAHKALYGNPPGIKLIDIFPMGEDASAEWKYIAENPGDEWAALDYDDSEWSSGKSPLGRSDVFEGLVETSLANQPVWLRKNFQLENGIPEAIILDVLYNHAAEIYINGIPATDLRGFVNERISIPAREAAVHSLREGENVISIRIPATNRACRIDLGLRSVSRID